MLTGKQLQKIINYWQVTLEENYQTMLSLYRSKRNSACLFFGHLILEKALKILIIRRTKESAPRIHNLSRLAELSEEKFTEKELDLLSDANEFNIEARYPEEKYQFYKKCSKEYTDYYYKAIKKLYFVLCQKIEPKK
jgi:HEPN domain-containing protein